jgi:hypothetical protein
MARVRQGGGPHRHGSSPPRHRIVDRLDQFQRLAMDGRPTAGSQEAKEPRIAVSGKPCRLDGRRSHTLIGTGYCSRVPWNDGRDGPGGCKSGDSVISEEP